MKTKALLAASALSLALAPATQADVTINITGSTAFRSVTMQAIVNTLGSAEGAWEGSGTALGSSNKASFKGTISGISGIVTVNTNWNGSVEGMTIVGAGNATSGWIDSATATFAPANNGTFGNRYAVGAAPKTSLVPTVACSDVYQSSTTVTASLEDVIGGVIPFKFVASESAPVTFNNMSDQLHEALWSLGVQPLSLFTGDAADSGTNVYAVGRDAGSGTRTTRLAETRYGITKPVTQWRVTSASGVASIFRLWPSKVEEPTAPSGAFNDDTLLGNGGYTSGSSIATIMGSTSTSVELRDGTGASLATGVSVVAAGHLGLNDASVAITAGAKELTYNGASYSETNVRNGKYTAWGYLHVLNQTGALTSDQVLARDAIVAAFGSSLFPFGATVEAGIDVNTMAVSRSEDGGLVGP
jgi:hypothetical protein